MAISAFLIWKKRKEKNVREALTFYFIQLILNTLWSIVFFGLKSPFFGFLEILILWFFIFLTILKFYKIEKLASYLLIPYILWVSFAGILNFFILILN
jgi:tryptophan-rich sensory protein